MAHVTSIYSSDTLRGAYVLVVDGDKDRRMALTGILRYCGALVTPVETPPDALAVMRLLKPDAVVVDFSRPNDAAASFIDAVRALAPEDGGTVPTVAISDDVTAEADARDRGFDAQLSRPLNPWILCRVVSELLTP